MNLIRSLGSGRERLRPGLSKRMKRVTMKVLVAFGLVFGLAAGAFADPGKRPDPEGQRALERYVESYAQVRDALRDVQMEVHIEARLPELKKKGVLHALRKVSALGKITYKVLGFQGDNMVKKDVIARYLEAEVKSSNQRTRKMLAITPANYKFRYRGKYGSGDWTLYLFQVEPKKKRVGMYRGWLWIHAGTGMPVRESGRLVKNPSVFLKRVDFVRDYAMIDGVAVPSVIQTEIRTRLVGPAEIRIEFRDIKFNGAPELASRGAAPQAIDN